MEYIFSANKHTKAHFSGTSNGQEKTHEKQEIVFITGASQYCWNSVIPVSGYIVSEFYQGGHK